MTTTTTPCRWRLTLGHNTALVHLIESSKPLAGSDAATREAEEWLAIWAASPVHAHTLTTMVVWEDATRAETFRWSATPAQILDEIEWMRGVIADARHEA